MDAEQDLIAERYRIYEEIRLCTKNGSESSGKVEEFADINDIIYFVSEAIEWGLFLRNIEGWCCPFKAGKMEREENGERYFDIDIGQAVTRDFAIEESLKIAKEYGFDDANIIEQLPSDDAKKALRKVIGHIVVKTTPAKFSYIHALAFVCTLCGKAADMSKMLQIALCAATAFLTYYRYDWIFKQFDCFAFEYINRY